MNVALLDPAAFTLQYDHALAEALAANAVSVDLLTSHYPATVMPSNPHYGVGLCFSHHQRASHRDVVSQTRRLVGHTRDMIGLRRIVGKYDILHFQWFALPVVDQFVGMGTGRPVVFTAHDIIRRETHPLQRRAQIEMSKRVDAVITHYRHGRDRLIETGVDPEKIRVIPFGAYEHIATQPTEQPLEEELAAVECPVVLFFGLLRPNKGVEVLIEAWRGITDAELWIVGMPDMDVSGLVSAAPPNVRFVSRWITEIEIPAFFHRADLVVLPYTDIDQSGVALTALAFGKPMLLTDVGGFADIAEHGAAHLVPPGDAAELHTAIAQLLASEPRREELAMQARKCASGPLSWTRAAEQTLSLYSDLLSSR